MGLGIRINSDISPSLKFDAERVLTIATSAVFFSFDFLGSYRFYLGSQKFFIAPLVALNFYHNGVLGTSYESLQVKSTNWFKINPKIAVESGFLITSHIFTKAELGFHRFVIDDFKCEGSYCSSQMRLPGEDTQTEVKDIIGSMTLDMNSIYFLIGLGVQF